MLVNGKPGNLISIRDRGLLYGDGVFRTFVASHGKAQQWPLHYRKLQHDCVALGIACPDKALLFAELDGLLAQHTGGVVKLIVTRGEGVRGYAPPAAAKATRLWDISPLPDFPADWSTHGIKARLCQLRLGHQQHLAGIKHLNRLENVLATAELSDAQSPDSGIAEGLMMDTAGNVIGGTRSNLFLVSKGKLVTPDLSRCGVKGVQRDRVIAWAAQHKMPLQVRNIGLDEVLHADELFVVNSVIGLWSINELEQRRMSGFPIARQIRKYLFEQGA
ncbi:MAG: aminodeoxychorismate lyase [Nitrosomonadales bacterium]|nr:aminodeoxychorismate lyase [Nitrosomonadales bacterium]